MNKNLYNYKETDTFTIIVGCFHTALSTMNRTLVEICNKTSIRILIDSKHGVNLIYVT